tara:strand:- start:3675 stop:3785 length:111 start_codon:yes stop_codon:yes gene_type:complete
MIIIFNNSEQLDYFISNVFLFEKKVMSKQGNLWFLR